MMYWPVTANVTIYYVLSHDNMAKSFDQLSRHLQNIKTLNTEITIANSFIYINAASKNWNLI
jgi:hypothetical protein